MSQNATISGILENRASDQGERPAYVFLSYGETGVVEERLTYAELDARARAIGASLQAAGAGRERVALLLPPGPDFIASFFGCLYAGAVAVPALPPRRRGADPRLQAICRDARPRVALATAGQLPALELAAAEIPELAAARRMAPGTEGAADWRRPDPRPEALAFLQYTSGSTSSPKGVMVSHGNLLHNEELIRHAFAQSSGSVVLGWLPLYHDMGLIGTVLQPLYTGALSYLMTPGAFLQRPARWLEAISRYRATTSGGPNFAYELCVRKVGTAEREGLDLSSWQVAFNGAEPVRAGTLRRFAAAFASCGFRAAAFRPCYGLAEATLLVSGWRQEGEPRVRALDAEALQRHEALEAEDTAKDAAADEDPRAEVQAGVQVGSPDWLRRAFAAAARIDPSQVDADLPLSAAGLDSLAAVELKHAVEEAAGVSLSLTDLLEGITLRELERRVAGGEAMPAMAAARFSPTALGAPGAGEAAGEHPLSWNQRSLWFLHRLAPESSAYNIAGAARLLPSNSAGLGAAQGEALDRAFQGLVDRHPMLRATFADTPGGPVQRLVEVTERAAAGFETVDATGWSDAEVYARLHAEAFRPFDLAAGPLLRAVLLRRGDEAFLALAVHHVAADFRSMAVLARELGALVAGETPPSPAALYTDFARRQEQMLESPAGERLWEHWRERLAGTPQLDLPTDRPRRPVQTLRGGARTLPPSLVRAEAVHRLAATHGCTPFVALLAAWHAVLSRWSGQEDFLTGAPMAGRSAREWGEVVGYFVNLVPLRANLYGGPAVRELMARTRSTVLDALAHQDLPFALLTERLQPQRDPSRPPLVAAMLTFEKAPAPELAALAAFAVGVPGVRLDLGGLALESLPLAPPAAQLDLSLTAAEWAAGLAVSLQWDADLFDAATIDRLAGHFERLLAGLAGMTAVDRRPIAELPLLSPAERHQMLAEWNDTAVPRSRGILLHGLFEAQAARTPAAPAAIFRGETLTYAALDARADRLARHLRRLGCVAESRVGVALERSLDLIVALLGVLKAGAAYVPLDPDYPRERLAFVLEDAAPQVLITETSLRAALPPASGTTVLCLDGEPLAGGQLGDPVEQDRGAPVRGDVPGDERQLAYVLYTSGSTGRPKGVGVPHQALVNFLGSMRRTPGFSPEERLLAVTSLSFDIAALEIFLPLTVGGCVELASRAEAADGALLAARLRASVAGVLQATPATWRMLLDSGWTGDPGLRALCGGEALPRELAVSLAGRTRELWNLYGPTETTVWSAAAHIRPEEAGPVSIGRPIADTQIHLLDRQLQTVPLGAPGELWIGGAGLSRGYLGRPDLTAERFLPNPLAEEVGESGGRLYRTGDLARHLPGGRMEVLGRIDHQVKVRGFRIELGEIEAVLTALPGVRAAVVLARESPAGDRRLIAYVVSGAAVGIDATGATDAPPAPPSNAELLQALRERLAESMVPSALVMLPALPLTPNGKVDRKALPAPDWRHAEASYLAPRTPVEEILAGIWAEVLGRERVGVADHFFDLGGHSLLATQVMSRLRSTLGIEVPLRDLFTAPRLADFAARVEAVRRTGTVPPAPPLLAVPREGPLPLSFAQQRLWFIDQLEPGSPLYNMPGALWIEGPLDAAVLALCLGEIVRRHEALRTVFAAPEGSPVQVIRPAEPFLLPVVDLAGLPQREREALVATLTGEEAARPFDLTGGPACHGLMRGLLLRLAERDHVVSLTLHHIVSDGWSMGILVRELAALYPTFAEGRPSPLPELPVQYADYAVWQRSWLHGEVLESEIAFWRRQLAGLPALLELPTDRPRPAVQRYRGATRPVRLPAALTRQVEALGRREGATLFMVLLAGFQTLLARYSGQDDLAVGSPVAGRNRVETEGSIGFFVNTLVLRGDLTGDPTFRELLGRVRETALAAYPHQDAPFEKLVEELAPERSLAQTPLFQVMFELQNVPTESLEILDLHLRPIGEIGDRGTMAKFDLTLALEARDGGLGGTMEHATDLFDAATIDRLNRNFARLLASAAAEPDLPAFDLPIASEAESAQILCEWNDTRVDGITEGCLHQEVAAQAARTPSAVAVELGTERWTYRRLVGSARRLARHLRTLGIGPDAVVGLCVERSPAMVVGMLAVLEAGGAWLPLDPVHPPERLAFLLDDAGARILLVQQHLRGRVPATGLPVVLLDGRWDSGDEMGEALGVEVSPDHLAYVIYTSGSTGRPKGVMVPHRGVCNRLRWALEVYRLDERDAFLQKASFGFDVSVWECFAPLTAGARLVLAEPGREGEGPYLARVVREHRVTLADFVPSTLAVFLGEDDVERCTSLRQIFVGGEALTPELRDRALARLSVPLDNLYGPTEVSIDATRQVCAPGQEPWRVPIGRPIGNSRLYVVDPELRPLPIGVAGELLVGGVGVTRGYLRRPGLTAERYVPDPFGGQPGGRLYRTGDLARWLPDGSLDFLGRLDYQVKVLGFRIELGEIEAALVALPGVREAAVLVHEDRSREDRAEGGPGNRRLVAYVVGAGDIAVEELRRSLREQLRERLPDHMVPAAFVALSALPLTPNGKVDRKALPAPEQPGAREGYVAPRTREEELLAAVWAQVLRLPRVGVNDNFFELGGDSILSVQIVARARQAGLHFTVRQIFEHQTVAGLARHGTATAAAGAARAGQGPVAGEVPLTPIQRWFFAQGFADAHHFNQALMLEPREPLAPAALERAMAAIVEHHDALRLRFDVQALNGADNGAASGWRQENARAEPVAPFHQVDLAGLPASRWREAFERAAEALQAGFDLSAGPLTRLCLFDTGTGQPARLLWVAHHLVVDGVSWRVLLEDLEGAYRQAARGLRPTLPPKITSFQEWARRLTGHAEHTGSEALARERDHWCETARAAVPRLPVDFPPDGTAEAGNLGNLDNLIGDEASVSFELTAKETADLLQIVPSVYHNRIDDALLSALVRALAGWTGSPRLGVDLEGHGREPLFDDLDVSRTVGWFTSLYPVVLEAGDAGPGDALVSAKERLRAVPGRGIGYGLLRHLGNAGDGEAARLLAAAPAAEILFNYLGQYLDHADATSNESSLFRASTASVGPMQSPRAHRTHALEIGGIVADGRLRITLTYGSRTHRRETAKRLAAAYAGALRQLIEYSQESEEVFTPSDFPMAGLDVHGFNKLASLLSEPVESVAGGLGLTLRNVADVYPLSPVQNGMLFHSLMAPESGVYVNQVTCTLPADIDCRLFRQAWARLVERHGVLRTAFLWDGLDEPLQVVRKSCALPWQDLDWRGLPAEEQQRRLEELRQSDRHTPLPLDSAPLMRFSLIRLDRELGFIWTSHHLLLDGWSLPLLVQELGSVYAALREGREPIEPILPPARPFKDYIAWLQRQEPAKAEPFWRGELAGFTAPNSLGVLGMAPPVGAERASGYAEHGIRLSREVTAELQALAARHKLTLQTVTLGAWAMLVSRYSSEEDVVFGGVVSGRPAALPGVETMVGMFVNTLPARVRVNGAETLAPWLQRLQERQLARQEFEHSPLAQIQRWSEVPAGSPLFETLYVFENYPNIGKGGDGGDGSLRIGNLRTFESTNYPLTLALTAADQVSLHLTSDRARVDEDAAPRLLQHLATLLAGMVEEPERRVRPMGELGLLTAAELRQILGEWNDTRSEGMEEGCLHHAVATQAARTPFAVAVELGSERWTYRRLVSSARLLARHLRELGIGPDAIVGLCAERSPAMVVGMLAILEAGGAYLPLDPTHPPERLAFMLADSGARALLIQEHLRERVPPAADDRHVVPLDARWSSEEEMEEAPGVEVAPDHLAYVIYTSGSTGRPKGVMVPHRGICNRLRWAQQVYRLGERDAVLQKASFGFDFSVWECFAPLWAGARLVLAEPGRQGDGPYLVRVLCEHRVTFVHFVPSMLAAFLGEDDVETCVSLRQVFSGGEMLTPELRDRALARLPAPLDNQYGPTEISIDTTRWVCAPGQDPHRVPIGRPIANSRLYVVDPELRPVPIGVAGELLVGGAGVTRGYLRRPDLTAERFIPDPFGDGSGGRLYRTGDLARWLPDGSLDFLGRLDHQVKVRGFRIELGEIEAALVALPGVHQAVVLVHEDRSKGGPQDRRLVAYVVGDAGDAGDIAVEELRRSLRERLRERLPDYMVPAAFVTLAALPLTANGKVDRKALPAPEQPGAREGYVAPRTREEEILATVWAQVLRLPRVGVNDNFFELGGDSILSVQIAARAHQAGLHFAMRQIFEHQTVAGLARHATATDAAGAARAGQGPVAGEVPLTPIQRWFFAQGFADAHHFNQALLLEPREPLAPAALERAMAAIVEHHDALRLRFDFQAPLGAENAADNGAGAASVWRQENALAEPVAPFHQVDLAGLPASRWHEAFERAATALQGGLDLSAGPLTRLCLFDAGAGQGAGQPARLFWVAHHLVVDGVSWRVLLEDLEGAYRQAARGLRPTLPPKTTSFQEWARRLTGHAEHAGSEALARERDYWCETARAAMPRLPVDFPSGGGLSEAGEAGNLGNLFGDEATVSFELSAEETADLLQTLPSVYHNRIDDALLSALVRALAGWTGCPRLRVDLEGHGREPLFDDLDVSRTVGWFTSLYPVVLEAGDAGPGAALVSAKERLRAVPGRGIGYGLLRHLGKAGKGGKAEAARLLEAAPEAEILFNYLGQYLDQADGASEESSLFRASTASASSSRSPRGHRTHPLEIVGIVTDGRLQITLTYGSRTHRRETAERLAAAYAGALRQLIQHSRESEEVFTPSDFPKARLDARSFDKLAALLAESD